MSQPWERDSFKRVSIRKKIKNLVKGAPAAAVMITVTYLCFLHLALVKKSPNQYNNYDK